MDEREMTINAAKECVAKALKGKANEIVCLDFSCALVWAESIESGVDNPMTSDLPEYAVIDKESGAIRWTEFSDLLNADQRAMIKASAAMCASKRAGLVHYTIGSERR